jgi:hypothetical protein
MPRFFFHVHDQHVSQDDEGLDLPDADAALAEAVKGARSLAAEQVLNGRLNLGHRICIADETGAPLATVSFGDAVRVEG